MTERRNILSRRMNSHIHDVYSQINIKMANKSITVAKEPRKKRKYTRRDPSLTPKSPLDLFRATQAFIDARSAYVKVLMSHGYAKTSKGAKRIMSSI